MSDCSPIDVYKRQVLGYVNTRSYSYADLATAINIYTGGITSGVSMYPDLKNHYAMAVKFEIRMKVLESNLEHAMKLAEEILNSSDLHDTKRLADVYKRQKSESVWQQADREPPIW